MKNTKFILTAVRRQNPSNITVTPELIKASKKWLDDRKEKGIIECMYLMIPNVGFTISNYDSAEDVYKDITDYPLELLYDFEVKPLASLDSIFEIDMKRIEASSK